MAKIEPLKILKTQMAVLKARGYIILKLVKPSEKTLKTGIVEEWERYIVCYHPIKREWRCENCPAFEMKGVECKHIKAFKDALQEELDKLPKFDNQKKV